MCVFSTLAAQETHYSFPIFSEGFWIVFYVVVVALCCILYSFLEHSFNGWSRGGGTFYDLVLGDGTA